MTTSTDCPRIDGDELLGSIANARRRAEDGEIVDLGSLAVAVDRFAAAASASLGPPPAMLIGICDELQRLAEASARWHADARRALGDVDRGRRVTHAYRASR